MTQNAQRWWWRLFYVVTLLFVVTQNARALQEVSRIDKLVVTNTGSDAVVLSGGLRVGSTQVIDTSGNVPANRIGGGNISPSGYLEPGGFVYPGRVDSPGTAQGSWYLASHPSYGLYSNTGLRLLGTLSSALVSNFNYQSRSANTVYTAASDGLAYVFMDSVTSGNGVGACYGMTDTATTPTTTRTSASVTPGINASFSFAVPLGWHYYVQCSTAAGSVNYFVWWVPMGYSG